MYALPNFETLDSPKLHCEEFQQRLPYPGIIYIVTTGKNSKAYIESFQF
jgi:hypothetical protein